MSAAGTQAARGVYVYGIVPADVEVTDDAVGVAGTPVTLVRHGEIAALVSEVPIDRPLGTPDDLSAHAQLLDGTSRVAPVLPLRFGAVLTDDDAIEEELLAANADDFTAALDELEGKAQYIVKGRYAEELILREILDENDEARELRDQIRNLPEDASREARMALGDLVNRAITVKREEDTQALADALAPLSDSMNLREPTHEFDAASIAALIDISRQEELEEAVEDLAQKRSGRVELRILGPLAAYDFVVTPHPES